MTFNRIAVYGHRGWVSSAVVEALAASGAPVRVLYRPGSDVSSLPTTSNLTKVKVDLEDIPAVIAALQDIDIVIGLLGQKGVPLQHALVKAIPNTNVKLFVPSDLSIRNDEQGMRVDVNKVKDDVEKAAQKAGIPTTVILPACFAESSLATGLLGVDVTGNRIIYTGDSAHQELNACTRSYVAAAYASIFASTPVSQLLNRQIGLSEVRATGVEIHAALRRKHGEPPQIITHTLEQVDLEIETRAAAGSPLALAYYCRKSWATGRLVSGIGKDIWEVQGFCKATLDDLIVKGKLGSYREIPSEALNAINATFQ
ncbi:hypothetical protein BKA67DRAFT_549289 [Truncatella angustata]|uniref:NmrA-like domain-containing protein n=1 Tax=Truncatella angustata TaxID=152316 RepID=A0A9P8UYQ1_9PEZI|nr:uncharacterized protein BKA67DRAFT_549289 [Truncatella angustata]KAH6660820.1 hypothetical protein BKA67DRAFT_549289 [Truncatella angustata]KAH8195171.1 hypothetical protein TruAng_010661 [Truncatella angustata]